MGGALLSPAVAGAQTVGGTKVNGNKVWVKYSATTYDISSTTANVVGGRIDINVVNFRFEGYEATRGDLSTNRPTLKATVNTMTLFTQSSGSGLFGNFNVDAGTATGIVGITTGAATTTHRVKATGCNATAAFNCSNRSTLLLCEAVGGSVAGFRLNGATTIGCVARDKSGFGFESASNHNTCIFCIADTIAATSGFTNTGAASNFACINCDCYGNTGAAGHGYSNPGVAHGMIHVNCLAVSNGGTGLAQSNASHTFNCGGVSNSVNFGPNAVQFGSVTIGSDPFTAAAFNDFSLNNTSGAGAAARGAGTPGAFPNGISTTGYIDLGAAQHSSVTSVVNSIHALLTLPRGWDVED